MAISSSKTRIFFLLLSLGVTAVALALGMVFYRSTVVALWLVILVAAMAAFATVGISGYWRKVTGADSRWINAAIHLGVVGSVAFCLLLLANRAYAGEPREERVHVTGKHYETHDVMKKVGRTWRKNGTRQEYLVDVEFTDSHHGFKKRLYVTRSQYNRVRENEDIGLVLRKGAFGFDVIDNNLVIN